MNQRKQISPYIFRTSLTFISPVSTSEEWRAFLFMGVEMSGYDFWTKRGRIFRSENTYTLLRYADKDCREEMNKKMLQYRNENLADITEAEKKFSELLDEMPIKYERELPIPSKRRVYFVDFLIRCPYFLIVEIDGGVHKNQEDYDALRDSEIMAMTGWSILRFTNQQVLENDEKMWESFFGALFEILELEKFRRYNQADWSNAIYKNFMTKYCPNLAKRTFKTDLHVTKYLKRKVHRKLDNETMLYQLTKTVQES